MTKAKFAKLSYADKQALADSEYTTIADIELKLECHETGRLFRNSAILGALLFFSW